MKELVLAKYTLIPLNCFALALFMAIFIGSIIWVYRKSGNDFYRHMEKLPLKGD